jgi:hypothetical protein
MRALAAAHTQNAAMAGFRGLAAAGSCHAQGLARGCTRARLMIQEGAVGSERMRACARRAGLQVRASPKLVAALCRFWLRARIKLDAHPLPPTHFWQSTRAA